MAGRYATTRKSALRAEILRRSAYGLGSQNDENQRNGGEDWWMVNWLEVDHEGRHYPDCVILGPTARLLLPAIVGNRD